VKEGGKEERNVCGGVGGGKTGMSEGRWKERVGEGGKGGTVRGHTKSLDCYVLHYVTMCNDM